MTFSDYLKFACADIIPSLGAFVISRLTIHNREPWYHQLKQPSFQVPGYVFPPVWTVLYLSMGIASYLVYRDAGGISNAPLALYAVHLSLNWAWPPIFFELHLLKWSLIEGLFLLASAITCGIAFYRVNKAAGWLFVPYVAWLSFASVLNYNLYVLNPEN